MRPELLLYEQMSNIRIDAFHDWLAGYVPAIKVPDDLGKDLLVFRQELLLDDHFRSVVDILMDDLNLGLFF